MANISFWRDGIRIGGARLRREFDFRDALADAGLIFDPSSSMLTDEDGAALNPYDQVGRSRRVNMAPKHALVSIVDKRTCVEREFLVRLDRGDTVFDLVVKSAGMRYSFEDGNDVLDGEPVSLSVETRRGEKDEGIDTDIRHARRVVVDAPVENGVDADGPAFLHVLHEPDGGLHFPVRRGDAYQTALRRAGIRFEDGDELWTWDGARLDPEAKPEGVRTAIHLRPWSILVLDHRRGRIEFVDSRALPAGIADAYALLLHLGIDVDSEDSDLRALSRDGSDGKLSAPIAGLRTIDIVPRRRSGSDVQPQAAGGLVLAHGHERADAAIKIKICHVPGPVVVHGFAAGVTVGRALALHGLLPGPDEAVFLDGIPAALDRPVLGAASLIVSRAAA